MLDLFETKSVGWLIHHNTKQNLKTFTKRKPCWIVRETNRKLLRKK